MNIGEAIAAIKRHELVKRASWKHTHIYLEAMWSFPVRAGIYKGTGRTYASTIVMYDAELDQHWAGWNPSHADLLAEDWEIVEA